MLEQEEPRAEALKATKIAEQGADASAAYQEYAGQYINGSWRPGRDGGVQIGTSTGIELFGRNRSAPRCVTRSAPSLQKRLYPKTLAVFLDASPSGKHRAVHAAALAQRWDAHVIGVHVVFAGVRLYPPSDSWATGERALQAVIAHEQRLRANAEAVAVDVSEYFQGLCTRWNVGGELRRIDDHRPAQEAILNALHSDLVIVGHPEPNGLPDDMTLETILVATGMPMLVVPNAWLGEAIGRNILIGWNASRTARRTISDAMPFLVDAQAVTTLVVDPTKGADTGRSPVLTSQCNWRGMARILTWNARCRTALRPQR